MGGPLSKAPFATVAVLAACAAQPAPVPVSGDEIGNLVGRWTGSYESPAVGRSGSIVFTLASEADSAHGDVYMIAEGARSPFAPARADDEMRDPGEVLTIRFVRASGGRVFGTLAPYRDPACGCTVFTQFEGELDGPDLITGTFRSEYPSRVVTGTWEVSRQ